MSAWPAAVRRHWFVAACAERLRGKPLAVTVLGVPLVLGRTASGAPFAFEDRCPHRQVALSGGTITEQGLACPYHGWTFGSDGSCSAVPGLAPGAALPAVRARTVRCRQQDGLVWVCLAGGADDGAPPAAAMQGLSGATRVRWQALWKAPVLDAIENFLDPLHTHTVHPGLVRRDGRRDPVTASVRLTPDGFRVDYRGQQAQSGLLYRLFESPRVSEAAVFAGAGSARLEYRYRNGSAVDIALHFTPQSEGATHLFASVEVAGRWAPRWALRLFVQPFLETVARQDRRMVEHQAAQRLRFAPARPVSTTLDLVRPYLATIWEESGDGAAALAPGFERDVVLYL